MENKDIKETRIQEPNKDTKESTTKDKTNNTPGPEDKTTSQSKQSPPIINAEDYNDQLAIQGFHRVISESIATPSKKYIKAIQRIDRKSTNLHPAEFWKYTDKEIETRGRF